MKVSAFTPAHVTRTHSVTLSGSAEKVFPLFSPLGEKAWAPGWEPETIYPPSGEAVEGGVFTVSSQEGVRSIWTIVEYDPVGLRIGYLTFVPGLRVCKIDVECSANPDGSTKAIVSYTYTALTEKGNEYIATQTDEFHRQRIEGRETAIDYYLAHGKTLQHH